MDGKGKKCAWKKYFKHHMMIIYNQYLLYFTFNHIILFILYLINFPEYGIQFVLKLFILETKTFDIK